MTAPAVVSLAESADISQVAELKSALQSALDSAAPITLAADAVERIDAATLQLLYAFMRHAKSQQIDVAWDGPTAAVHQAANLLGMHEALGLPASN